jgi:hypothetical protein
MCIERPLRTCIILHAPLPNVETFATLAGALGVSEILMLASPKDVEELQHSGWNVDNENVILLTRRLK